MEFQMRTDDQGKGHIFCLLGNFNNFQNAVVAVTISTFQANRKDIYIL